MGNLEQLPRGEEPQELVEGKRALIKLLELTEQKKKEILESNDPPAKKAERLRKLEKILREQVIKVLEGWKKKWPERAERIDKAIKAVEAQADKLKQEAEELEKRSEKPPEETPTEAEKKEKKTQAQEKEPAQPAEEERNPHAELAAETKEKPQSLIPGPDAPYEQKEKFWKAVLKHRRPEYREEWPLLGKYNPHSLINMEANLDSIARRLTNAITELDPETAEILVKYGGGWTICLDGVKKLSQEVAEKLVKYEAGGHSGLSLNGIEELDEQTARILTRFKGDILYLDGLKELTPKVAKELAKFEGWYLYLNGLRELTPEVAAELAKFKGNDLSLNGVRELTPEVAAELAKSKIWWLSLWGLNAPSRKIWKEAKRKTRSGQ